MGTEIFHLSSRKMSVKSGIWSINDVTTESNINFVLPSQ